MLTAEAHRPDTPAQNGKGAATETDLDSGNCPEKSTSFKQFDYEALQQVNMSTNPHEARYMNQCSI